MFKSIFSTVYKAWAKMMTYKYPQTVLSSVYLMLTITTIVLTMFGAMVAGVLILLVGLSRLAN